MAYRTEDFEKLLPLVLALPNGTYFDTHKNSIEVQASGDEVQKVRAKFPGCIWEKVPPHDGLDWWSYTTTTKDGVAIKIYADSRGPLSCKRFEETVTTTKEVDVPVTTRKEVHEVTEKIVRWECPEEAEA